MQEHGSWYRQTENNALEMQNNAFSVDNVIVYA